MNKIFCQKYKKNLTRMNAAPFPGDFGQEILTNYSKEAWDDWIALQTMLINEGGLDLSNKDNRKWLSKQMKLFLENGDYKKPDGFTPISN
tara:strand:- start:724 stop:993 length:270 start_codon:yes stop_codon:yes gene_type:complete